MKADQHGANTIAACRMLGHSVLHDRSLLLVPAKRKAEMVSTLGMNR